jgi:hypothetical protein
MLLETWLLTSVVQESKWIWAAAMDWEALEEGDENEVKVVAVREIRSTLIKGFFISATH